MIFRRTISRHFVALEQVLKNSRSGNFKPIHRHVLVVMKIQALKFLDEGVLRI